MDLSIEVEDFDSELLIWDHEEEEDDKHTSTSTTAAVNTATENGGNQKEHQGDNFENIELRLPPPEHIPTHGHAYNEQLSSSMMNNMGNNIGNNYQQTSVSPNNNRNDSINPPMQQPSFVSLNNTGNEAINPPFLNTFISTLADKPTNVLNAGTGLPLFLHNTTSVNGIMTNQQSIPNNLTTEESNQQQTIGGGAMTQMNNEYQLEPIFPPNFFLSGLPSWEPSQSKANNVQQISQLKSPAAASLSQYVTGMSSGNQVRQQQQQNESQQPNSENWDHVQVSKHIAMLQANQNQANNNNNHLRGPELLSMEDSGMKLRVLQPMAGIAPQTHPVSNSDSSTKMGNGNNGGSTNGTLPSNTLNSSAKTKAKQKGKTTKKRKAKSATLPPFYLFDAPVELRHNFMQAQQGMNIPPLQDSNSYHYSAAVNSVQPKMQPSLNMFTNGLNNINDIVAPNGNKIELLDARQKKAKRGNERNEREQQRAQKITVLIDKLRTTMVQGGWKCEMKSKYQTLSTCAEYVKHLISVAKDKEEKLEETKVDLAIRQRKLKEERVLQDSRSDPDSVISTLTTCTSTSNVPSSLDVNNNMSSRRKDASRCAPKSSSELITSSGSSESGANISLNKMSSSISDMTDNNKESSDEKEVVASANPSSGIDVSSTAAVVSVIDNQKHAQQDKDIVIKTGQKSRKRKHEETSLDEGFALSYEEVFMSSNVPQIIATLAGRISTCNDFFHRVTGISQEEAKRITIFSLVQTDNLSSLYELVAKALCMSKLEKSKVSSLGSSTSETTTYETITLPCIQFPKELPRNPDGSQKYILFMHVTFIDDENPKKRCLHCALSDTLGKDGKHGFVSSELLVPVFS